MPEEDPVYTCQTCGGSGSTDGVLCTNCYGSGLFPITGEMARLLSRVHVIETKVDDITDKCNDTMDKCNDIMDKCNDILEQVSE